MISDLPRTIVPSAGVDTGFTRVPQTLEISVISQITKSELQDVPPVYLVGAGPGDPGLITVRGANLLALAEVVVYDALVNPALLSHCEGAEKIYVGKRAAAHSMTQERINELLIERATRGKRVVRLKGGDPFVFGRGGEECEALAGAGIRFEVVPGITAAIAAPAYAGIPVTHRDFNSSFTFLTGHEKEEEYREAEAKVRVPGAGSDIDWASIARLPCVAFYMGVKSLPRICQKLMEHGLAADTPAATIQSGTLPSQRTVIGTVADLPMRVMEAGIKPPALTIVGKVVSLRKTMNWFETRPLFGKTIVVTRAREQASELSEKLQGLGANVLEAPAIDLVAGEISLFAGAVKENYDWIVFTSVNGVRFTRQRLAELKLDVRVFGKAKIAAIGEPTARAIESELALYVDLLPTEFVADALADALLKNYEVTGKKFLLLRADIGRPLLNQKLEQAGAMVKDIAVYETRTVTSLPEKVQQALEAGSVDWITFASSSSVKNFFACARSAAIKNARLASIGPVTSSTLVEMGYAPTVEASVHTIDGLIQSILGAI